MHEFDEPVDDIYEQRAVNSGSVAKPSGCHKVEHMGGKVSGRVNEFSFNRMDGLCVLFIVEVPATAMLYVIQGWGKCTPV